MGSRERDIQLPNNLTDSDGQRHFPPPGVTSSGSSDDTNAWATHPHLSSQDYEDENNHAVQSESSFDITSRKLASPFGTPEGLLPRKSTDSIRRKLGLPPRGLDFSLQEPSKGVEKVVNLVDHDQFFEDDSDDDNLILPPPDFALRSQPTMESSVKSPVVSTSSFYSRPYSQGSSMTFGSSKDCPVAESPDLQVGKARTAVGALVALREASTTHNTHPTPSRVPYPALPSPLSEKGSDKEQPLKQQDLSFSMSVLPPRGAFDYHAADNNEDDDRDSQNDTPFDDENNVPSFLPPAPRRHSAHAAFPSRADTTTRQIQGHFEDDVKDDASFLYASPSTLVKSRINSAGVDPRMNQVSAIQQQRQPQQKSEAFTGMSYAPPKLLTESKCPQPEQPMSYDDWNEDEIDESLMRRKFQNQLKMKQQLALRQENGDDCDDFCDYDDGLPEHYECEEIDYQSEEEDEEEDEEEEDEFGFGDHFDSFDCDPLSLDCTAPNFDKELVRRKSQNQRQEKEKLLLQVVARLRDNVDLVADVGAAASSSTAALGSWFVETPLGTDNLLTGFSTEQRNKLLGSIDSILKELDLAQPEEFFVSPSKVPSMATTHDTLHQALYFCKALVMSAIPQSEKEKMLSDM